MAEPDDALASYVEDLAVFFEKSGLPRIAGRILGLLLVCDPPHRSASQLVEEIQASKASVSNMARLLLTVGLIERVGIPGDRATYYALADDGFEKKFEVSSRALIGFRPYAVRGLALLGADPPARTERLRRTAALYAFWEREMPLLLDKWRDERDRLAEEMRHATEEDE